jgi:threonine dehydratase
MSVKVKDRTDLPIMFSHIEAQGMKAYDASHNEMAKAHARYLIGGRKDVKDERLFRFSFPERPGALGHFLNSLNNPKWNSNYLYLF